MSRLEVSMTFFRSPAKLVSPPRYGTHYRGGGLMGPRECWMSGLEASMLMMTAFSRHPVRI